VRSVICRLPPGIVPAIEKNDDNTSTFSVEASNSPHHTATQNQKDKKSYHTNPAHEWLLYILSNSSNPILQICPSALEIEHMAAFRRPLLHNHIKGMTMKILKIEVMLTHLLAVCLDDVHSPMYSGSISYLMNINN
jgi:hypothetical protein